MLPARVQGHASSHPHRTALVAGADRLSYAELDRRVAELGGRLLGAGVARSALVGIHLDRGPDVVVSLLAVLSIGAAFLIVEPGESSAEGIVRLASAGPDLVLVRPRDEAESALRGLRTLATGAGLRNPAGPADLAAGDLAYVALTSGSTGVPKGVMVSHGNIRHYTEALLERLGVTGPLDYAHVTTLAADLGNTSLFLALWTGGTLHLVDDAVRRDPRGLLLYLRAERVDVLKTTPSHWSAVFRAFGQEPETSPVLRFLLLGGELLGLPLARRILASGVADSLVNHYGPTETTVGVAANVLRSTADLDALGDVGSVPVGTALGATRLMIRTADGRWTDRDAVGELYVGGPSVSLGYRADPAATGGAFPRDVPGLGRAYRTGDRVRADDRGVLEFLGRGDRQVKINGYRVELGHVEAVLRRLPGVVDACAVQLHRDRPVLVAAVVLADPDAAVDLRDQLRRELPSHMCPDRIEPLDAFPRTANGKTDEAEIRGLLERRAAERSGPAPETDDPVLADVIAAWQRHLGHGLFGVHDMFDRVGGNSLDAIQVVADLQAQGYAVSATTFMAEPTVGALAAQLRTGQASGEPAWAVDALPTDDSALSPSQQWFFRQAFAQPDHWNQMLLLDLDGAVSPTELTAAINDVVGLHPLLHTAFRSAAAGIRRVVVDAGRTVSVSELPEGEDAVARHVQEVAAARQAEFDLTRGAVFRAHLFLSADRAALLLIGHHLCVDAVSWQTVINDISRCYSRRLHGDEPRAGVPSTDFGTWATYLRDHAEVLRSDLAYWDSLANRPAIPAREGNCERDAQAVWFRLSQTETEALGRAATGVPVQAALIGAVATALAHQQGDTGGLVDVESHGRAALDEALEMSRTVGWCTSSFPVRVDVVQDLAGTVKAVAATLDDVPHLGIAYGLHARPKLADVCVNYLGPFSLSYGDDLRSAHSRIPVGPARGPANERSYALKLTARLHDGQLVADLSYTPAGSQPERVLELARATRGYLVELAGHPATQGQYVVEHGSSIGLLAQVPQALHCEPPAVTARDRDYSTVLLTGATGFLGAHLLHLLLTRTEARVRCLVRASPDRSATSRLRDAYGWCLPTEELDSYADRVTVLAGDLTEPDLGLAAGEYAALVRDVDAIYHLAADTRLFGGRESFSRQNTEPVRALIRLAGTGRRKDLHHVSTLAVSGTGTAGEPTVFSEDSLEIGQRFLNEYERSKYVAEQLVREFTAHGGTGFVYRSGNVTGHSKSGRFQRNGADNRFVQTLRAAVALGRVPKVGARTVALSPVDVVAEGILAISRSARVRGGTFHVDTPHQMPYEELFTALRELGYSVVDDEAADFAALFGRHLGQHGTDEQLSLAHFWATRPERNVSYDHTRTRRLLAQLGVEFPPLGRPWLRRYFTGLAEQMALPAPTTNGSRT